MITETFILPSGIECEVTELTGLHQRLLTEQKGKKLGDNLNEMLASLLVRVGNYTGPFDLKFVQNMLSADRRTALAKARMFSVPDDEVEGENKETRRMFRFTWKYDDKEGNEKEMELEQDLTEGFPVHPYAKQWANYDEVDKFEYVELPRSKERVRFNLLDGIGEYMGGITKKDERSSHTPLLMRNPCFMRKGSTELIPIKIESRDLDKMSLVDIEALRSAIKKAEGRIDTEMRFEHPEAEFLPKGEKYVIVDLLDVLAFFFPSEAI